VRRLGERGLSWRILGGGTNLVVGSHRLETPVISLWRLREISFPGRGRVEVESGVRLQRLVTTCVRKGLGGLEGLAGIPGTVGGAVAMNSGGSHGSICDHLRAVTVVTRSGRLETLCREQIRPAYRSTELGGAAVVSCTLELEAASPTTLLARSRELLLLKSRSQPIDRPSAGCIFKNPQGSSAGALIDSSGLKGLVRGSARVSRRHANFIVHDGRATSQDVVSLIREVQIQVADRTGIELELEVRVW
jgi:UDP-N-acetylmuramate dehydrogenase